MKLAPPGPCRLASKQGQQAAMHLVERHARSQPLSLHKYADTVKWPKSAAARAAQCASVRPVSVHLSQWWGGTALNNQLAKTAAALCCIRQHFYTREKEC